MHLKILFHDSGTCYTSALKFRWNHTSMISKNLIVYFNVNINLKKKTRQFFLVSNQMNENKHRQLDNFCE